MRGGGICRRIARRGSRNGARTSRSSSIPEATAWGRGSGCRRNGARRTAGRGLCGRARCRTTGGRLGLEAGYRFEGARAIRLTFDQDGRGGGRSWGLGGRFAPDAPRNLFIEAEASHSESEAKAPEHGIGLKLRVNW